LTNNTLVEGLTLGLKTSYVQPKKIKKYI